MSLLTVFKQWLRGNTARKWVVVYLVVALLVVLTITGPVGLRTAQASSLSNSTTCLSQLELSPTKGPPQKSVYVCGYGFVAASTKNVKIDLYSQATGQSQFIKDVTPTNGDITTNFKMPTDPQGKYYVQAYQQSSGVFYQAPFTIIPGFTSLNPAKNIGVGPVDPLCAQFGWPPPPGNPLTLGAAGLPASAAYQVMWENKNTTGTTTMASGTTTSSGTLSASFTVPAEPGGDYYLFVITPYGPFPIVTYYSGTYSCFSNNQPGDGYIYFQWDGVGWDANSTVTFTFNGSQLWTVTADPQGSFGTQGFMQKCPPPGTYQGTISGTANGQPFSMSFNPPVTVTSSC